MQKIVINNCHGGFGLSEEALKLYKDREGIKTIDFWDNSIPRDSKTLVQIVQELGKKADGKYSELGIVEVPDEVDPNNRKSHHYRFVHFFYFYLLVYHYHNLPYLSPNTIYTDITQRIHYLNLQPQKYNLI